ncbi:MAG: acyl transferase [Flavobacteriales bacterium]|nr:acyl transferase [Flavobacteriales bacterium]
MDSSFISEIFKIENSDQFWQKCTEIFKYQYAHCKVYREFIDLSGFNFNPKTNAVPFLPIKLFKHTIVSTSNQHEIIFKSSGTGGLRSNHYVHDLSHYNRNTIKIFQHFYGDPENYAFVALLPSYIENGDSSLVHMVDQFISKSKYEESDFYLNAFEDLNKNLEHLSKKGIPTIFLGVSYALLDFSEQHEIDLNNVIIMETGGMKGRRKEMTRRELHEILMSNFNSKSIHSEYGMTELLSQAYSLGNGKFEVPQWMKVMITALDDPTQPEADGSIGRINIIDLANIHSCSFIATEDIGRKHIDGSFEILGRLDTSEMRGCNLLYV